MSKSKPDPHEQGEAFLKFIEQHPGPAAAFSEAQLRFFLWQEDSSDFGRASVCAFEALTLLCQAAEHGVATDIPLDNTTKVEIPWWIVKVLASGWIRYERSPSGSSLGEAFRLKGGGQGKRPMLQLLDTERRNMVLALQVEHLRSDEGGSLSWEDAIAEVARRKEMSASAVRDAYRPYRRRAKEAYERFRAGLFGCDTG